MKKAHWFLICSIAFGLFCILFVFGCVGLDPQERAVFDQQREALRGMVQTCNQMTPAEACVAVTAAYDALETVNNALGD